MSYETLNLTPDLYLYLQENSLRETPILEEMRRVTKTLPGAVMQISPEQGQFMGLLIELLGAKKTLDLGTFTGYSALVVAQALPEDGKVITCDIDEKITKIAKECWQKAGVSAKIDLRLGPAKQTLQALIDNGEAGSFDFIFIDADKNNYDEYYELAFILARSGGLIAIDNVLWDGKVADKNNQDPITKVMRKLNQKILKDERVTLSLIPIGDGLTLARKR